MSHAVVLVAIDGAIKEDEIEAVVEKEMKPFDENGRWFKDGSRWDWYQIGGRWNDFFGSHGSIVRKSDFNSEKYMAERRVKVAGWWEEMEARETARDPVILKMMYGIELGETKEQYVDRRSKAFPCPSAYLKERHWHEGERMGWFGTSTATECELKGEKNVRRCKTSKGNASLVTWNEDDAAWNEKFYDRFIKPLDDDEWLVAVDYHV